MATLFQLHTNIDELQTKLAKLSNMCQKDDHVLLLGKTPIFANWINSHSNTADTSITIPQQLTQQLNWYALSTDIDDLQNISNQNLQFAGSTINLLTDKQWIDLAIQADKVVSLY